MWLKKGEEEIYFANKCKLKLHKGPAQAKKKNICLKLGLILPGRPTHTQEDSTCHTPHKPKHSSLKLKGGPVT